MFSNSSFTDFFAKENSYKVAFFIGLFILILVYGYELTHFTLSIDEEFNDNFNQTVMLNRWGHAFLKKWFFPEPYIPFFTALIALIFLSCSLSVITKLFELDISQVFVFGLIYLGFPQFAYQLEFSNQADTVSFAILLSTIGVYCWFCYRNRLVKIFFSGAIFVFSLGVYQSLIFYIVTLYCATIMWSSLKFPKRIMGDVSDTLCFSVLMIFVLISYSGLSVLFKYIYDIQGVDYLKDMVYWLNSDFYTVFKSVLVDSAKILIGYDSYYGLSLYSLIFFYALIVFYYSCKRRALVEKNNRFFFYICAVFLLLSPVFVVVVFGHKMQPRTMLSMSLSLGAMALIAFEVSGDRVKKIVTVSALIVFLNGSMSSSRLFYADKLAYDNSFALAHNIVVDIKRGFNIKEGEKNRVFIWGSIWPNFPWKPSNSDSFGGDFFSWDGGNPKRITGFINSTGISNFSQVDLSEVYMQKDKINSAPVWPREGSIFMINEIIVVKISDKRIN